VIGSDPGGFTHAASLQDTVLRVGLKPGPSSISKCNTFS
jgi:hypothetical protein